ncbi:MAG: hypothetical protein AB7D19_07895 [Acetobacter sp.]|uniref:hypothetical protein n=1 Tax=Acetobacter sp. TaxID=440 RepID=UPI003CFD317A
MMPDVERLRKVWALVERGGSAGECAAARERARVIAERYGYVLDDIPVLLAGGDVYKAREVRERQQREREARRREAEQTLARKAALKANRQALRDQADEITGRYEGRLFCVIPDESILVDAVQSHALPGWRAGYDWSSGALEALRTALPLPKAMDDVLAELKRWTTLRDDRQFVRRAYRQASQDEDVMPEPVLQRMKILADLVQFELVLTNIEDLMKRVSFQMAAGKGRQLSGATGLEAILRDLDAIRQECVIETEGLKTHIRRSTADRAPDQAQATGSKSGGQRTATERRAAVEAILRSSESQKMTLREIASRVGVSPATVLNIRRRMKTTRSI